MIDPLEQFSVILFFCSTRHAPCATTNLLFQVLFIALCSYFLIYILRILFAEFWLTQLIVLFFVTSIKFVVERLEMLQVNIFVLYFLFNFIFVLILNISGMFVFTFTLTSHLSLTFFLSLTYFIGVNLIGVVVQGQHFFNLFLPKALPLLLTPLLFFLEVISYFSRVFSLAIRLFANMLSGHALMKILAGIAWNMVSSVHVVFILLSAMPILVILAIIALEFTIAFLQAYVFFVLTIIYMGDLFVTDH